LLSGKISTKRSKSIASSDKFARLNLEPYSVNFIDILIGYMKIGLSLELSEKSFIPKYKYLNIIHDISELYGFEKS